MWAEERQQRIMAVLASQSRVEADELATSLNVSRETIRRDLKQLEALGQIRRTHGGALMLHHVAEQPFHQRLSSHTIEKQAIAVAAAALVEPGSCCFVDAGSTTTSFAQALASVSDVSVITNSIDVAMALRQGQGSMEILLLGGTVGRDVPATFGASTIDQLETLRADFAFISPVGIHPEAGVSYFDLAEAAIARVMLKHARRRVALADASKCGLASRTIVSSCKDIDVLVTDLKDGRAFSQAGVGAVVHAGE